MQTPSLHFLWKADIITTYLRGNCETDKRAEYYHSLELRNYLKTPKRERRMPWGIIFWRWLLGRLAECIFWG